MPSSVTKRMGWASAQYDAPSPATVGAGVPVPSVIHIPPPTGGGGSSGGTPIPSGTIYRDFRAGGESDIQTAGMNETTAKSYIDDFNGTQGKIAFTNGAGPGGVNAFVLKWPDWNGVSHDESIDLGMHMPSYPTGPTDVWFSWKFWWGRIANDGVDWGNVGEFDPTNPEPGSHLIAGGKRGRFLGKTHAGADTPGMSMIMGGAGLDDQQPDELKYEDIQWRLVGAGIGVNRNGGVYDDQAYVGMVNTVVVHFKASTTPSSGDGMLELWVNDIKEIEDFDINTVMETVNRWKVPTTIRDPFTDMTEYTWDMVCWTPDPEDFVEDFSTYAAFSNFDADDRNIYSAGAGEYVNSGQMDIVTYKGEECLKYEWPDQTSNPQSDYTISRRFDLDKAGVLGANPTEVWAEIRCAFSSNWDTTGPGGGNQDYKWFTGNVLNYPVAGGNRYGIKTGTGGSDWVGSWPGGNEIVFEAGTSPNYWDGNFHTYWLRWKLGTGDGVYRFWRDGVLVYGKVDCDTDTTSALWALQMGANMNQGSDEVMQLYWSHVKVWTSDPGW